MGQDKQIYIYGTMTLEFESNLFSHNRDSKTLTLCILQSLNMYLGKQ